MTIAEYGFINTFPKLARLVERTANSVAFDPNNEHALGALHGLTQAMIATKQCGDAAQFVEYAVDKAARAMG